MSTIGIKRVYLAAEPADGFRVLVDRLWPRGLAKSRAAIDLWARDLAPSTELRLWFGHDPGRWMEFQKRYRNELKTRPEALIAFRKAVSGQKTVTLLYAAVDEAHNQAVVLARLLTRRESRLKPTSRGKTRVRGAGSPRGSGPRSDRK